MIDANSVHWSRKRSNHSQQCHSLYREHSYRPEYVQARARFYLYCKNIHPGSGDLITDYPCLRHENGTRCEMLLESYLEATRIFGMILIRTEVAPIQSAVKSAQ